MLYTNDKSNTPLALSPSLSEAWHLRSQGRSAAAAKMCSRILSHHPQSGEALHLQGVLSMDRGEYAQAVHNLKQAIAVEPNQVLHYNNLGVVLNSMQRYEEAARYLKEALEIDSSYFDAQCNLGLALYHQHQFEDAARCFEEIISGNPEHDAALANLGMTRLAQKNPASAARAYERALEIDSSQPAGHGNLAAAYMHMGYFEKAVRCYDQAIEHDPRNVNYPVHKGIALRAMGDLPGSLQALELALSIAPKHSQTVANLVVVLEYTCHWKKLDLLYPLLERNTQQALKSDQAPDEDPMLNIRRSTDIKLNQSVARAWSRRIEQQALRIMPRFTHPRHCHSTHPITLGYLSNDFRNHPVTHQLFPLFRLHDRNRFRVIAFSMGPDDRSNFRKDILSACDEFVDISTYGLSEAARIIYDKKVDILVDLMGHSHHNRMEILALRPAPIQVSYLGYLSTTGADYIDYIVADPIVVPPEHNQFFDEKLIRLPHCYQLNHAELLDSKGDNHQTDWGLPQDAFIFCCFNNTYKIDRPLFDVWMRILMACPNAVLWLCATHEMAASHMKMRAVESGINPQRLIFAEKIPLKEHLKRLSLAHLALDTIRYNGGATTANALSVGLPVLTMMGTHWVSRMSASHLVCAGLTDLVYKDLSSYEEAAIDLAGHPDKLRSIKLRLTRNAKTHALFNTKGFIRHLESGYDSIWSRYQSGQAAAHIDVPNLLKNSAQPINRKSNRPGLVQSKTTTAPSRRVLHKRPGIKGQPTIYYFCPDGTQQSAGIRRLYRHVAILHAAGFSVSILYNNEGFHRRDLPQVPVRFFNQIEQDPQSIFVIPEGMPGIMHRLKDHPGRRFVIALSWHYIFSTLPDGMDWRQMNIERVLAASPTVAELVTWSMGLPVHHIASFIDLQRYHYDQNIKRPQIAFIKRKGRNIEKFKRLLGSKNIDYINKFTWVALEGMSERIYSAEICKSSIFLSTSMAEGYPTSFLEAMSAGTIVAGYDAVGGRQLLCGQGPDRNCILAASGDYVSLAYELAPLLDDLLIGHAHKWAPLIANAQQAVAEVTPENEADCLISFWHKYSDEKSADIAIQAQIDVSRQPRRRLAHPHSGIQLFERI